LRRAAWAAAVLAAVAALAAPGLAARADAIKLPNVAAEIEVPRGWTAILDAAARGLVAGYRGERGVVAAVTRAPVLNYDAYQAKEREAYADRIERGIAARVTGYRRVTRRISEQRGTPTLDLEARRDDGATIVVRVLLFWTYATSLAIEVPAGADAGAARAVAASFAPPAKAP
jgi:hypothetical protein